MEATSGIKHSSIVPKKGPGASGLVVKPADKRIYLDRGNSASRQENLTPRSILTVTASSTLTAADDGTVVIWNAAAGITTTLPPTAKGLTFHFCVKVLSTSGVHAISPNANDKIFGPGITAQDDKDLTSAVAADTIGDFVTLVGDGLDGWFVIAIGEGTPDNWTREA